MRYGADQSDGWLGKRPNDEKKEMCVIAIDLSKAFDWYATTYCLQK